MKACKFEGCDRPAVTRGMCNAHYKRWLTAGKPSDWDGGPPIGALPPKPCVDCGAVLHPVGRRQLRCEPCAAAAQKASQRNYRARVRAGQTMQRRCKVCGKAFKTTDLRRVTCGGECSQTLERTRAKVQPKERVCVVCGQVFETTVHNKVTCGTECSRERTLARKREQTARAPRPAPSPPEPVDWDAVLKRIERNAGPRTAALAHLELRRLRQRRAESEVRA